MWVFAAAVASLLGAVICRPPIVTRHGNFSTDPVSPEFREWLVRHATHRSSFPPGFKFMYFSQDGRISPDHKPADGHYIKVVGSPLTSQQTLYVATLTLIKMMKHTPEHIFNRVANSPGGAGIFTSEEKLTVFPDFAVYADTPACHGRCDGRCSYTCTFDGRKVDSLGGVTATLSLVLDDNVMCTASDPYRHIDNILVHEFAHMVDKHGLTPQEQAQNRANYNSAKSKALWNLNTYAMANPSEYFGESSGAFFLVNLQSGGMTSCSYGQCRNEMDARNLIKSHDLDLYNFLVHVWTNGHADQVSGLHVCYRQ